MEKIYLTKNDHGEVEIDTNLTDAKESCASLSSASICAWTDALPRKLFATLEKEDVCEAFEKHIKDVEQICSKNWD